MPPCSMEGTGNPPGQISCPGFNPLRPHVPCSGRAPVGTKYVLCQSVRSLSLYPFPQTCVTYRRDRRSRCTARTGVTLNSPSYCPGSSSARQGVLALSQYAPTVTTAVYQPRPALIFLRRTHIAPACHISVPNLRIPRVLAGATGVDPNFSPRGRQAGDIPTRPTPREFRKPALRLP